MKHVPPILQTKGLVVKDVGQTPKGNSYILLGSDRGKVREVTIYLMSSHPSSIVYGYTIRDDTTRTETTYHGGHGDPERDQVGPMEGV